MWAILQTHGMKTYPDNLVLAFLYNLSGTIISATTRFIAEIFLTAWRLRPSIPLLATIYLGSFGLSSGILVHIYMGPAHELSCLCIKLQAIVNCHCCCFSPVFIFILTVVFRFSPSIFRLIIELLVQKRLFECVCVCFLVDASN